MNIIIINLFFVDKKNLQPLRLESAHRHDKVGIALLNSCILFDSLYEKGFKIDEWWAC